MATTMAMIGRADVFPHHLPVYPQSSDALLAAIVESSDDAILSKDLNGTVTSWNRGAERILGYKAHEMIGQSVLKLIPPELYGEERDIMARLRAGERIEHFDTTRLRKDGQRLELSLTISPIRNEAGRIVGASKVARDISERRRMERHIIQTEKLLATGKMAATIAHEMNNPLESIINLIYLARTNSPASGEVNSFLLTAEREIERVSLIARQSLGYFRETTCPVLLHLEELTTRVLSAYETKLAHSDIALERDLHPTRPLNARKGELTQVLSNLVSNAVDAMPTGGKLRIAVAEVTSATGAEGVQFEIEDNGSGIPDDTRSRIFDAFFTTKKNHGTGIGLWVSHQFIESHGGTIHVESRTDSPDHGTLFRIFLPYNAKVPCLEL